MNKKYIKPVLVVEKALLRPVMEVVSFKSPDFTNEPDVDPTLQNSSDATWGGSYHVDSKSDLWSPDED